MTMLNLTKNRFSVRGSIKSFLPAIFGAFLISAFLVGCGQQDRNKPTDYMDIWRVGDKAIPAAVYIEVITREETSEPLPLFASDPFFSRYIDFDMLNRKFSDKLVGQGTGMIIDDQGHILTNNHVVRGATRIEVRLASGKWCLAKLIGTDPETDLAVIRISDQVALPYVTFGDSNSLTMGEPVATVGYMRKICETSSPRMTPIIFGGIIRITKPHGITFCSVCPDYYSTDIGNNWGNSGAILLNRHGEVVGIDVAILTQSNDARTLGFAIPSNTVVNIVEKMISHGLKGA